MPTLLLPGPGLCLLLLQSNDRSKALPRHALIGGHSKPIMEGRMISPTLQMRKQA